MSGFSQILHPILPSVQELSSYLEIIDRTRIYSNFGPLYHTIKERLAEYFLVGSENVALATNGTLALSGLLEVVSARESSWTVPSWTFVATAHAVTLGGRQVSLADVNRNTWQLVPEANRHEILVLPFGASLPKNLALGKTSGRIIDAAASFDALRGVGLGAVEDHPIMVSAHATKLVSMGEGGFVLGSSEVISDFERWLNFDFCGNRVSERRAVNAKPSEYACAVGLAHLNKWEDQRASYFKILGWYEKYLSQDIRMQPAIEEGYITSTLVITFTSPDGRGRFLKLAEKRGIATRMWWGSGLHTMPLLKNSDSGKFPVTNVLAGLTIGIPFHLGLTEGDVRIICDAVNESN